MQTTSKNSLHNIFLSAWITLFVLELALASIGGALETDGF
jgi:hypothetical protein